MSTFIRNNYKKIFLIVAMILLVIIAPMLIEIIFKAGNIVGTIIRNYSTNGICF